MPLFVRFWGFFEGMPEVIKSNDTLRIERVRLEVMKAMATERERYNRAANDAGSGRVTNTPIDVPKKKGKGGAKKKDTLAEDSRDFDIELQQYAHKETMRIREEGVEMQAASWDAEQAIFDKKTLAFDRELEILNARGTAEEEAQTVREALLDRRMEAERTFARGQLLRARTDAQREQAQTKIEEVEYRKRLMLLKRASADDDKEQAKRVKMAEKVSSSLRDLGTSMVDSAWEAARGTKGAMLDALSSYFKGVSKEMTMVALVNAAKGVAAAASIGGAWQAPGYFIAAAKAGLVAVAAGGAAVGLVPLARSPSGALRHAQSASSRSPGPGSR